MFQRASRGQPLRISAEAWNAAQDVARAYQDGSLDVPEGQLASLGGTQITVKVYNTGTQPIPQFGIVGIGKPFTLPHIDNLGANSERDTKLRIFQRQTLFRSEPPTVEDHFERFGIAAHEIPKGGAGDVIIRGVAKCKLYVVPKDDFVTRAAIMEGDEQRLTTHPGGPCVILYKHTQELDDSDQNATPPEDPAPYVWTEVLIDDKPPGWERFRNNHANPAPPWGLLKIEDDPTGSDLAYRVMRPDGAVKKNAFGVNGPVEVEPTKYGYFTRSGAVWVGMADQGSEPAAGRNWGFGTDSWHLVGEDSDRAVFGFESLGKTLSDQGKLKRTLCDIRRPRLLKVKPVADITAGNSGECTIVNDNGTAEGRTVDVYLDWMHGDQKVSADKQAVAAWYESDDGGSGRWSFLGAECESES